MNQKLKPLFSLLMVVLILAALLPVQAAAAEIGRAQRWNIALVMDGSGSLVSHVNGENPTDPNGLRYEAAASFLAVLQESGHNVGGIVFSGNKGHLTDDEEMAKGILADTGIKPIRSSEDKAELLNAIRAAEPDNSVYGTTDIGTALLRAARELSELDNGLPSAIYLFTDGGTAIRNVEVRAKSMANLEKAIEEIQKNDIRFCGVYLNDKGRSDSDEVRDIACRINDITPGDPTLDRCYVELTDSASCLASTDVFLSMLGFDLAGAQTRRDSFLIPGTGVEEVNIRINTLGGKPLTEGVTVTLTRPDGSRLAGQDLEKLAVRGETFKVYKVNNPMSGLWKVRVVLPEGCDAEVEWTPVISCGIDAWMTADFGGPVPVLGKSVKIRGQLAKDGVPITHPGAYDDFTCNLTIKNLESGHVSNYEMKMNEQGEFTQGLKFRSFGTYDVSVAFECENIVISSPVERWIVENHPPKIAQRYLEKTVYYDLFFGLRQEVDLNEYINDLEDGIDLGFHLLTIPRDEPGLHLEGSTLVIEPRNLSADHTLIDVIARDKDGGESVFSVDLRKKNLTLVGPAVVLVLVLTVLLAIRFWNKSRVWPDGSCYVNIAMQSLTNVGQVVRLLVCLPPPGFNGTGRNTTLYGMLKGDLDQGDDSEIRSGLIRQNLDPEGLALELSRGKSQLEGFKISCVTVRENGKKTAKIRFLDSESGAATVVGDMDAVGASFVTEDYSFRIRFRYEAPVYE